ncbi:MAG: toxin-antitoxin system YwqK family antitoxin [Mangrovibacterium sp.]
MNSFKYYILVFCLFQSFSCKRSERTFYSSGQLAEVRSFHNKKATSYTFKSYYPNGQIKTTGCVLDGHKNGFWKERYSDGKLKWACNYNMGVRVVKIPNKKPQITLSDSNLRANISTHIRVNIEEVHPFDFMIACNNGQIKLAEDSMQYLFTVRPKKSGIIRFHFLMRNRGDMIEFAVDSFQVMP